MSVLSAIYWIVTRLSASVNSLVRSWGAVLTTALLVVVHQTQVAIAFALSLLSEISERVEDLTETVVESESLMDNSLSTIDGILGAANTYIPVDFVFSAITVYASLWAAASIIRVIKSFIPTVAS